MSNDVNDFLKYFFQLYKLKEIERYRGFIHWRWYPKPSLYDSVASHKLLLAQLVICVAPYIKTPFNLERALKIALFHDFGEIYHKDESPLGESGTGADSHAFNAAKAKEKFEKEKVALEKLLESCPNKSLKSEVKLLWEDHESKCSFEARLVGALDKLEGCLQVWLWRGGHFFPIHRDFNIKYAAKAMGVDPFIDELVVWVQQKWKKEFKRFRFTPISIIRVYLKRAALFILRYC